MLLDTEASAHTGALSSEQLNYLQEYRGRAARALTHGRLFAAPVELSVPFAHDHEHDQEQEHEQTGTGLPLEYVEWELKQAKVGRAGRGHARLNPPPLCRSTWRSSSLACWS